LGFQNYQGFSQVVEHRSGFSDADSGGGHGGMGTVQTQTEIVTSENAFWPANRAGPVILIMNQQPVA
jgi:hypothetical protein